MLHCTVVEVLGYVWSPCIMSSGRLYCRAWLSSLCVIACASWCSSLGNGASGSAPSSSESDSSPGSLFRLRSITSSIPQPSISGSSSMFTQLSLSTTLWLADGFNSMEINVSWVLAPVDFWDFFKLMLTVRIGALFSFNLVHLACFPSFAEIGAKKQQYGLLPGMGTALY